MNTDPDVVVALDDVTLPGTLRSSPESVGLVVFAHGSGSSRLSPRNTAVADDLLHAGLATLLFDLLTPREAADRRNVFDISLLGDRLAGAVAWTANQPELAALPVGLFGASTGAGAALTAAARLGDQVRAVVSRGGRPDLAGDALPAVTAPTLLVVGERDETVRRLNRQAQEALRCRNDLVIVPGASHLFEEPGALEAVAQMAGDWFLAHLPRSPA